LIFLSPARAQQELDIQVALGVALRVTKGLAAPEVAALPLPVLAKPRSLG